MWTGVPLMQIAEEESERLLRMEDELKKSIISLRVVRRIAFRFV